MCECGATGSASQHLVGSASCSLACPVPQSTTSLGLPAAALPRFLPAQLPVSAPPTGLDECFFFISLVVGLPYNLIFYQFWLFFVLKLLLSFFWLCEEAQCVYLHLHLGRKSSIHPLSTTCEEKKQLKRFCSALWTKPESGFHFQSENVATGINVVHTIKLDLNVIL